MADNRNNPSDDKDQHRPIYSIILTGLLLVFAVVIGYLLRGNLDKLDQIGSFISGIASSLAFIWLIEAYRAQRHELSLQRRELSLQREALAATARTANSALVVELATGYRQALAATIRQILRTAATSGELQNENLSGLADEALAAKLVELETFQRAVQLKITEGDQLIIALCSDFVSKFSKLEDVLARHDQDKMVQTAILVGTPFSAAHRIITSALMLAPARAT